MSRTARTRPTRGSLLIGAMIGALALTGCGAGQVAQTAEQVAAVDGANSPYAQVVLRDAQFQFPEEAEPGAAYLRGSDAPLSLAIVNQAAEADRLLSVTSEWASSVLVVPGTVEIPGGGSVVVEGAPAPELPTPPSGISASGTPATGTPTTGTPEGDTPASTATPPPSGTLRPATTTAEAEPGTAQIVLTGLREDLRAGLTYDVVFTFERAGEIRVPVPIGTDSAPREDAPAE